MCKICDGNYNDETNELDIRGCQIVSELPVLPQLEKLLCSSTNITEIPVLPVLKELYCDDCTSLTTISVYPN